MITNYPFTDHYPLLSYAYRYIEIITSPFYATQLHQFTIFQYTATAHNLYEILILFFTPNSNRNDKFGVDKKKEKIHRPEGNLKPHQV